MSKKRYAIQASTFDAKGRLICTRNNSYTKTHPLQKHFASLAGEHMKEFLHAEIHCLIASRDTPVHKLVVIRYNSAGRLQECCPCLTCQTAIRAYGVKEVHYSTTQGVIKL